MSAQQAKHRIVPLFLQTYFFVFWASRTQHVLIRITQTLLETHFFISSEATL